MEPDAVGGAKKKVESSDQSEGPSNRSNIVEPIRL